MLLLMKSSFQEKSGVQEGNGQHEYCSTGSACLHSCVQASPAKLTAQHFPSLPLTPGRYLHEWILSHIRKNHSCTNMGWWVGSKAFGINALRSPRTGSIRTVSTTNTPWPCLSNHVVVSMWVLTLYYPPKQAWSEHCARICQHLTL